jgi:hypothetical protein
MGKVYTVTNSALVDAPADLVYSILADYVDGHPHILPPKYFTPLSVEQGGVGDGTIFRVGMRAFGMTREFRAAVTEPEPGREMVETALEAGGPVTTFTVEPEGTRSRVTFDTMLISAPGLKGLAERLLTPQFLRKVYARELEQLNEFAASRRGGLRPAAASEVGSGTYRHSDAA